MSRILFPFWKSEIMTMLRDFLVLYYTILSVSIDYKSSMSVIFSLWLLVVRRSKIWTFAWAVNLLAFPEFVCKNGLPLLQLLSLLPCVTAEGWEICACGIEFTDWDFYCGLGSGLISLKFFLLWRLVFGITSCKRGVFCFTAFILRYLFFFCSHCLSHNVWVPLHSGNFCALFWRHFEVIYGR